CENKSIATQSAGVLPSASTKISLGPLVGLSDAIVDLVSTGSTLRANHLVEVEQIMDISSRLVVNRAALKTKREKLQPIIEAFERAAQSKK
nr:hypothetical protein [Oxalobacteraceae bacterium]